MWEGAIDEWKRDSGTDVETKIREYTDWEKMGQTEP